MALHDTVVRRIKAYHEREGDDVTAELPGYQRPPKLLGARGRAYIPDVYVFNKRWAYEVKEYWAHRYAVPKLKAFVAAEGVDRVILVLCSGTADGVERVMNYLAANGVDCEVMNFAELPFW